MLIVLIVLIVLLVLLMLVLLVLVTLMLRSIRSHCASNHTTYGSKSATTKLMTEKSATCSTDQGST